MLLKVGYSLLEFTKKHTAVTLTLISDHTFSFIFCAYVHKLHIVLIAVKCSVPTLTHVIPSQNRGTVSP